MTWRELISDLSRVPEAQLDKPVYVAQTDGEVTVGNIGWANVDCEIGTYRGEQLHQGEFFIDCYSKASLQKGEPQ
jgi:hypothetical protein